MKLVIIGGVAGGAASAARARRLSEDAEIILFERGEYISFANCGLPYCVGGEIKNRSMLLVATPQLFRQRFRIDVRLKSLVTSINRERKTVSVTGPDGGAYEESYDKLIISTGAEPARPPIPGIDSPQILSLRTIPDMDRIIEAIEKKNARKALVIGGGFIGLEMVENLKRRGLEVAVIEMLDQVMPPFDHEMAALIRNELENNNIAVWLNERVNAFEDTGGGVRVALQSGRTIDVDFVLLATGVVPEGELAGKSGLRMGIRGSIVVDDRMKTSDPDIYAVGDAVQVFRFADGSSTLIPLAGPAAKEARVAVNTIFGIDTRFRGVQGSSICRVFGITAACTGLNEKTLRSLAQPYGKVYVHPANHAGYYPGAYQMTLKVLYNKNTGVVLGAQCIGPDGIDKRIDVISMAIQAKMTIRDLSEAELCYAPPFGSSKDPVNFAGYVAVNDEDGVMPLTHWDQLDERNPDDFILLDTRTSMEYNGGHAPGAVNIPVDAIRNRLDELEPYRDREILIYCATGVRSHVAGCILKHHGFRAANISGGYRTYCQFHPKACTGETKIQELQESFCGTPRQ